MWTPDDEDARIARDELPGYAGSFLEPSTGDLVIQLRDTQQADLHLAQLASRHSTSGRFDGKHRRWKKVEYDFNELKTYFDAIASNETGAKLSFMDIDERINRVVVGIDPSSQQSNLHEFLLSAQIPEQAIVVRSIRRAVWRGNRVAGLDPECPECWDPNGGGGGGGGGTPPYEQAGAEYGSVQGVGLQARQASLVGGLRTEYKKSNGDIPVCSIGATAEMDLGSSVVRGFITASHCSRQTQGGLDGTLFMQGYFDGDSQPVARKTVDPPYTVSDGCSPTFHCRYSDAQFAYYDGFGRPHDYGYVALPLHADWNIASERVLIANLTGILITQRRGIPLVPLPAGTTVYKVGQSTGYTTSTVTETCVTAFFSDLTGLLCQYRATGLYPSIRPAYYGDSGSPVLSGPHSGAMFEGIVVSFVDDHTMTFSPWIGIAGELRADPYNLSSVRPCPSC